MASAAEKGLSFDETHHHHHVPSPGFFKPRRVSVRISHLCFTLAAILLFIVTGWSREDGAGDGLLTREVSEPAAASPPLEVIEVTPPVSIPASGTRQQTLMEHSFAYSYGQPFIGMYIPPACDFNRVVFNFSVLSAGRQYDRLGIMYFNDTEIFRTSTAEPTTTGIHWEYLKDMSNYLALFKQPQKIIFDLGNLINDVYTAPFNCTLTATFFSEADTPEPADVIIPVSARKSASDEPSAFSLPDTAAVNNLTLPQNVRKAFFTISACGQSAEEFWWNNVPSSTTETFDGTTLYGFSPFREVQLYIDGTLAGVAWPFPVIFTGGVAPGFWRPVVGIDAFDLREDEIDITPFLPLLCDNQDHSFEIRIAGLAVNGSLTSTVGSYWVVTGKIFLWLDEEGSVTSGTTPVIQAPPPSISQAITVGTSSNGTNMTLQYAVQASRQLSVVSIVTTTAGNRTVSWDQNLSFLNRGNLTDQGNDQLNEQRTSGTHSAPGYRKTYRYPLWCWAAYATEPTSGNFTIDAAIDRGKSVRQIGDGAFSNGLHSLNLDEDSSNFIGADMTTRQNGTATYLSVPSQSISFSSGETAQDLVFAGVPSSEDAGVVELYHRHVLALNGSLVEDEETLRGRRVETVVAQGGHPPADFVPRVRVHDVLGRGPAGMADVV